MKNELLSLQTAYVSPVVKVVDILPERPLLSGSGNIDDGNDGYDDED